jgi:hypothetical protein
MAQPAQPFAPAAVIPGRTLGIVAMILSIVGIGIAGIVLGIIGMVKSKKAGHKNGFALAGIIIGIVSTVIVSGALVAITLVSYNGITARANADLACSKLGTSSGTVIVGSQTYSCSGSNATEVDSSSSDTTVDSSSSDGTVDSTSTTSNN